MILRPYQTEGITEIGNALRAGETPCYVLPTGAGKTVCFADMARKVVGIGKSFCILVHRRELLFQCLKTLDCEAGVIAAGFSESPHLPIQVAMVQSLKNRLSNKLKHFDFLVVDEAHHATASTYMQIFDASPNTRKFGVTATPIRMTGKCLGDLFTTLVVGPSVQDLVDLGHLCPAEVYSPSTIDTSAVGISRGDFKKAELAVASDTPSITGDAIKHYTRLCDGKRAIAFCCSVEHARNVAHSFREAGYQSIMVCGKTPKPERDDAIQALSEGRIHVLSSCEIINEGVDVPAVEVGIMLRPTKSLGLSIQQVGRCLRPFPGKDKAIILDHAGNTNRFGRLPEDDIEWSLEERPKQARTAGADNIRQCPMCYFNHSPRPQCPNCGYFYPVISRLVEEVEGELVKVKPKKRVESEKTKTVRKRRWACKDLDELRELGKEMGYKARWADIQWNLMRGRKKARAV